MFKKLMNIRLGNQSKPTVFLKLCKELLGLLW